MSKILSTFTAGVSLIFQPLDLNDEGDYVDSYRRPVTLTAETDGDAWLLLPAGRYRVSEGPDSWGMIMVSFDGDNVEYLGDIFLDRTVLAGVRIAAMLHRVMQSADPITTTEERSLVFRQDDATAEWSIQHNFGRFPAVRVVDSAGSIVEGAIAHESAHHLTITFPSAFCGRAFLS